MGRDFSPIFSMLGQTAPQVMLMEVLVLPAIMKVRQLEMKVEYENAPLPLFLVKVGVIEELVVQHPLLLQEVEVMVAVLRALRGLEPW